MNWLDSFEAVIKIGAPLTFSAWFLFTWLYRSGEIDRADNHRVIKTRLKGMKKSFSREKDGNVGYVYNKWTQFGSGFYGLAGLWTFVVIEFIDFVSFVFNFPGYAALTEGGLLSFVFDFLINQLTNMLSALLWFTYWPADSMLIWVLVAYLGYLLGIELARRNIELKTEAISDHLEQISWLDKIPIRSSLKKMQDIFGVGKKD